MKQTRILSIGLESSTVMDGDENIIHTHNYYELINLVKMTGLAPVILVGEEVDGKFHLATMYYRDKNYPFPDVAIKKYAMGLKLGYIEPSITGV